MPINFNTTSFSCTSSFLPVSEGEELERQLEASGPPDLDWTQSPKDALEALRTPLGDLRLQLDQCTSLIAPLNDGSDGSG